MGDCMVTPEWGRGVISMQNIVAALAKKDNLERWKNVVDLEKYGQPAAEFLIQALSDEDRWVRYLAADALANIGATNSIDSLISLLRTRNRMYGSQQQQHWENLAIPRQ